MRQHSKSLRLVRRLLLFTALVVAPLPVAAEERINIPAADFVKAAIAKQQYDLARQILDMMLAKTPSDIEANFLMAQIDDAQDKLPDAVERYRKILTDHPDLVRVRLELARALFLLKEDDTAEYHFRLALASDLPPEVKRNIQIFLDAMRARRNWNFTANAALAPNTNINAGPSTSQVNILGLPFTLSNTAKQQSGTGVVFTAAGEYDVHLTDTIKLRDGASFYRAEYPGKSFDDLMTEFYAGPQWLWQSSDLSLLGVFDRRWFANDPYNVGYGPRVQYDWNVTQRLRLESQVEYLQRDYRAATSFLNGYMTDLNTSAIYSLTPTSYARVIAGVGYEHTQADFFANKFYRLGVGYHDELPWGISVEDQPEVWTLRYEGVEPLFGVTRDDLLVRNTLSVYKRDWHLWGFSPTFTYVFSHNSSNIPLFSYTQHQFQIGVTKQF
jgi:tetratricopeptide (TPR) repeat protein